MDTVELNDVRLAYRLDGPSDAPVVVFCNSLSTTHRSWDLQVDALSDTFRILRFDTRGHGESSIPSGPYTTADMAADLKGLLDQLDISRPVHVVGLSLGGMVAMDFAARWPERVASLVLCATAASMAGAEALWNRRIEATREGGTISFAAETLARWFTDDFATAQPDLYEQIRGQIAATPDDGYIAAVAAVRDVSLADAARTIEVPTFLIAADDDPATPAAGVEELGKSIPGARGFRVIGPARHLLNVEQPAAFNKALRNWLTTLPTSE